eukprot:1158433-Pelagomonas_calceolata.AAC.8
MSARVLSSMRTVLALECLPCVIMPTMCHHQTKHKQVYGHTNALMLIKEGISGCSTDTGTCKPGQNVDHHAIIVDAGSIFRAMNYRYYRVVDCRAIAVCRVVKMSSQICLLLQTN